MGICLLILSEPFPKKLHKDIFQFNHLKRKAIPDGWSTWDSIEIKGPLTIKEFVEYFKKKYNVNITKMVIGLGKKLVLTEFDRQEEIENCYRLFNEYYKNDYLAIKLEGTTLNHEQVDIAIIKYIY